MLHLLLETNGTFKIPELCTPRMALSKCLSLHTRILVDSSTSSIFQQGHLVSLRLETKGSSCCSEWWNANCEQWYQLHWECPCDVVRKENYFLGHHLKLIWQHKHSEALIIAWVLTAKGEDSIKPFSHILQVYPILLGIQEMATYIIPNQEAKDANAIHGLWWR